MCRMFKIHLPTALILLPLAGILCALNLQYRTVLGELDLPPPDLRPVGRLLFFRGWPLAPAHVCIIHGMEFHPEEDFMCWGALVFDAVLCLSIFGGTAVVFECYLRTKNRKSPPPS